MWVLFWACTGPVEKPEPVPHSTPDASETGLPTHSVHSAQHTQHTQHSATRFSWDEATVSTPWSDGVVGFVRARGPDSETLFIAQFWETVVEPELVPTILARDTCLTTVFDLTSLPPSTAQTRPQTAGAITLTHGAWEAVVLPDASGAYFSNAAGLPSGAVVDVSAAGDAFPGFSQTLTLPPDAVLLTPQPDFRLVGDLDLTWRGGDDDLPFVVRLEGSNLAGTERGVLLCAAWNDGQFTVPAQELELLPAGGYTVLHVSQMVRELVDVGAGGGGSERLVRFENSVATVLLPRTE